MLILKIKKFKKKLFFLLYEKINYTRFYSTSLNSFFFYILEQGENKVVDNKVYKI
jgi:hypothetical protein